MGKQWKQRLTFFSWAPKSLQTVTAARRLKRCLLLGRKAMTNLDSILKSKDITLPTEICLVKTIVFIVVKYGCESWTIRKAKCQRIDAFVLWCWRRPLGVPWTARSNQSILKEINPEHSLEGLMLKRQYFGYLMQRANSLKKTICWERLRAEEDMTEDDTVGWHHRLNGHEFGQTQGGSGGQGSLVCCSTWGLKESNLT